MPRTKPQYDQVLQLPQTHSTTIPEEYLDAMGHMNVMWYTHLFSVGMGSLMNRVGLQWEVITEHHAGTFALESHVRYYSEVRVGQTVDLYGRVLGRSDKRFHAMQFMVNRDKRDVSASLEVVNAYIDLQVRRMASLPDEVKHNLDELIEQHQGLAWPAPTCDTMGP
ncbi:MAG: thioesterase family protein [bacterium]|nr:thioesterase family protein [bacterium]